MSDEFERREESYEKRFAMSEEKRFKALARRNKVLGLWAAHLLGYEGEAATAHAVALIQAQVGRDDVVALAAELGAQFSRAGVDVSDHRIARRIEEATAQALQEVAAGR